MTVIAVGLLGVLVSLCALIALYSAQVTAAERARSAADQAALAAASAQLGSFVESARMPCDLAGQAAQRNGARLVSCRLMSTSTQVEVRLTGALGREISSVARAGSPEGAS